MKDKTAKAFMLVCCDSLRLSLLLLPTNLREIERTISYSTESAIVSAQRLPGGNIVRQPDPRGATPFKRFHVKPAQHKRLD